MRSYVCRFTVFTSLSVMISFCALPLSTILARTIQVTLTDSSILPKTIQANKNESIHINIVNKGTKVHNFVVPKFYVFSPNIQPNGSVSVRFTPDKTGAFQYYSDKKGIPEQGIKGLLYVHQT